MAFCLPYTRFTDYLSQGLNTNSKFLLHRTAGKISGNHNHISNYTLHTSLQEVNVITKAKSILIHNANCLQSELPPHKSLSVTLTLVCPIPAAC